jgi:hypothetical protein
MARRLLQAKACGTRPKPSDLAADMNVEVIQLQSPPPAQPTLRSEYSARPDRRTGTAGLSLPQTAPRITLYADPINALGRRLREACDGGVHEPRPHHMMRADLTELHIAHELFHHLETVGRACRCPHARRGLTREESETAAHAFARELMGLGFEPEELEDVAPG